MMETSSDLPRKSLAIFAWLWKSWDIFRNFRKMFSNVLVILGKVLENLCKSSESGRKSSENHQIHHHQYVNIIKRTLHVSSKTQILSSRSKNNISLMRYCSCYSNIKFISSHHPVISSVYIMP